MNILYSMIRNLEQWVYYRNKFGNYKNDWKLLEIRKSSKILTHSPSTVGSAHVSHRALIPSSSKKPSRAARYTLIKGFPETFLIVNLPDQYLNNYIMIQEIWQHHRRFREEKELRKVGVESHCNQSFHLAFREKQTKKVWTTAIVLSLWLTMPRVSGLRNFRAGLWSSEQRFARRRRITHAPCSGSRKSKQPNRWMTSTLENP